MNGIMLLFHGIYIICTGTILCLEFHRKDTGIILGEEMSPSRKYEPVVAPWALFLSFLVLGCLGYFTQVRDFLPQLFLAYFWNIFVEILFFYSILLLLLPLLRNFIRPSTIAALWLLPNLLYITCYTFMRPEKPLWIISISKKQLFFLLFLWLISAAVLFLFSIFQHFVFRNNLLKTAVPVADSHVLTLWSKAQEDMEIKHTIPLSRSSQISTPLSIGLWKRTTHLVLPEKHYDEAELNLIFRHELIHIHHRDSQTKLFIKLCNALCWFNPLMWLGMKKCSEDLELSCDEMVLKDGSQYERRRYANLILNTAGDERGFTTCLSASYEALQYRLRGILSDKKKFIGSFMIVLILMLMILPSGMITLAYSPDTVNDLLFGGNMDAYPLRKDFAVIQTHNGSESQFYYAPSVEDEPSLREYLGNLRIAPILGTYELMTEDRVSFHFETEAGLYALDVYEHYLTFTSFYHYYKVHQIYYIYDSIDMEMLRQFLVVSQS